MVEVSTSWTLSILTDSLLHISICYMNTPIGAMTVLRSTIKDQRVGGGPIPENPCSFPHTQKRGIILPHMKLASP